MEWTVLDWNKLAIDFYRHLGARHMKEWLLYRLLRVDMESILGSPEKRGNLKADPPSTREDPAVTDQ